MTAPSEATVHASAVLTGRHAVLVRGPAGSGKSRLVLALLECAQTGALRFVRLVGDDRVMLAAAHGRLLVRPAKSLSGKIEVRGLGIRRVAHEPVAVIGLVVDLAASDAGRLPEVSAETIEISGIRLPRLPVAAGENALPAVLAKLGTAPI